MNIHRNQIAALKLAIGTLERERRSHYAAGDAAYRQGIRPDKIDHPDVQATAFVFAERDHKEYERYTNAIQELGDLIDILQDPGVTYEDNADLPLFQERVQS